MARVLIVVPPLAGHVNPLVAVAAELRRRGHSVTWAGSPRIVRAAVGPDAAPGAVVVPAGPDPDGPIPGRPGELRAFAALRHLWEGFLVPLAHDMLPGVDDAVRSTGPDLVLADQQAMAGPLVALRHGVAWVTSASTSAELGDPFAALPRIGAWITELQAGLYRAAGFDEPGPDLRFSPDLTLAFTAAELAGPPASAAGPVRFVGPSVAARPDRGDFPWSRLDPPGPDRRPLAVVTLGTANAGTAQRFLAVAHEAFSALADEVRAVIADPAGVLGATDPAGPIVVPWIPQPALLARAAVAVCHGGHNTVVEALGAGVPLVIAPIRDDQPVIAQQVLDAGAGLRVRFDRVSAADLTAAVREVLAGPHAAAAAAIARALAAAGGSPAAADAVESVVEARLVGVRGSRGSDQAAPTGRSRATTTSR